MSLIVAEFPHHHGDNFPNSSMHLGHALDPPAFNPDLTKSRLNDALCLCEMLPGTLSGRGINGGLGGFVLGVV
jgi:hypothetical protein